MLTTIALFPFIFRGMAVRDPSTGHGVKLVVEDYRYAADGLELWTAIKEWNEEYLDIYYKNDKAIKTDTELQNWWGEIRNQAHADKKDAPGWPEPNSKRSLVEILTTLQWIASCQHAAVNFGQFDYAGFMPHHPTLTRRLLPEDEEGNSKGFQICQFLLISFVSSLLMTYFLTRDALVDNHRQESG